MISIEGLGVSFGGTVLFDHISFVLNKKERIALVGKNGAGKSTLLKILAGIQQPTTGVVSLPKEVTIGYLPQQMELNDTGTVREEAEKAFDHLHQIERKIEAINVELTERTDYESDAYHELIDKLTHQTELLQMLGGSNYQAELERTLLGLGFEREDFERKTTEFSGGWRMRIELAKLILRRPDVLLLDEPTNHLDIESIQWLENFMLTRANAVVLVSHDRAFLDNTTTRTIEIELGKIYDYKTTYSHYVELRKERREQQLRAYENQQKKLADTEAFIERFRYKATKAVQVQSRIKQLEKIDLIEVDDVDNSALHLKFPPAPRSGSYPVIAEGLSKRYGEHLVFAEATFTINRGEKVAFVGRNGEGKSTLVKCIMDEVNYSGKLQLGHNVKIGYFAQNQASLLDENLTVFETIDYVAVGDVRTKIRDILGAFMFGGEASDKKVQVLSGGERSRLAMIRLLLEPVNLLILDEPTNHLDMRTKEILKEAIKSFDGTAIIVSHDRSFMDGLVTKVYEFKNQRVIEHLGGIYEYLQKRKIEDLAELERSAVSDAVNDEEVKTETMKSGKRSYEEQKEYTRQLRKFERGIEQVEKEIAELEKKVAEMEKKMAVAGGDFDAELYEQHGASKQKIAEFSDHWLTLTLEKEAFEAEN